MPTKFLNLSTDTTLGGATPSDELAVSQRAIKLYVDSQSGSGSGSAQSVGNVFWTMRTDNELNGAVECNGATYDTGDFTGSGSIGTLLAAGRVPYVSLAQYATLLSSQGSCGVFGWDGGSTTEFRVPSLNDIFIETGTAAQVGDYVEPGLPNLIGTFASHNGSLSGPTGVFAGSNYKSSAGLSGVGSFPSTITFDASSLDSIYGNSTTVQPNAVRYRAMVQLATGATDEALETCTGVLADVANLQQNKVSKGHEVIEFQAPTAQNNYTWYRKYADGWVEQGGITTNNEYTPVNLPVAMADDNYVLLAFNLVAGSTYYSRIAAKTSTTFTIDPSAGSATKKGNWMVSGVAAS